MSKKANTDEEGQVRQAEVKAKKEVEQEAKEAKEKEKREAKEAVGAEFYEGSVELVIAPPVDLGQARKLEEYLSKVEDLHIVLVGGSVDEGTKIVVSAGKPIPLINVLREMPPVEEVVKKGKKIQIMLRVGSSS